MSTLRERAYSVQGGLTAALAPELSREAIWDAFFDRRTYATSGERILLEVWVENATRRAPADPRHARAQAGTGQPDSRLAMGQVGSAAEAPRFRIRASGTAPLDLVEVLRDDRRVNRWVLPAGTWDVDLTWTDPQPLGAECAYYVRVTQSGFAFAWSSPIWFTCTAAGAAAPRNAPPLPAWHEGVWPPPGGETARAEAAAYLPALQGFLERQSAAGRYVELEPVGVFREHRGRFVLFRGFDGGGPTYGTSITHQPARGAAGERSQGARTPRVPVHVLYYPDFPEDRIRVGVGWVDFGVGRTGPPP